MKDSEFLLTLLLAFSLFFNFWQAIAAQNRVGAQLRIMDRLLESGREVERLRRILANHFIDADLELDAEADVEDED